MIRQLLMSSWFRHSLDKYRWYRKWYGGRWEFWCIDILPCPVWLHKDPAACWPKHKQCCGIGEPVVEDWDYPISLVHALMEPIKKAILWRWDSLLWRFGRGSTPMLKAIQRDYKELIKEHPDESAKVLKDSTDIT